MTGNQSQDDKNGQTTIAGCLVVILSLAVIGAVAIPVVTWRDPESGRPLPRMVAIVVPVLAGALCCGICTGILKILGISVMAKPKTESPDFTEETDVPPP
jgi:hypothetical protein